MNESPILYLLSIISCARKWKDKGGGWEETHGTSSSSSASSNSVETSSRSSLSFYSNISIMTYCLGKERGQTCLAFNLSSSTVSR